MDDRSQSAIDEAEWNNPANWHGGPMGIYYSKRDSRAWVPKPNHHGFGATVNFAHRSGLFILLFILGMAVATICLALFGPELFGS